MEIRIGTRGSKLALIQAQIVSDALKRVGIGTILIPIETQGDKILDVSLHKIGSKGVFTEELEEMLRLKEIDIAVHSAKDLPSFLPEDLDLIAFGEREISSDALVSYNADLRLDSKSFVIGTSSTRRVALLKRWFPNHSIIDMRGNLITRLEKLKNGKCDALILAYAGIHRLGLNDHVCEILSKDVFTPPVGQGSIAIQALKGNQNLSTLVSNAFHHNKTGLEVESERAFLATMEGGCSVPVFGHAEITNNQLNISGGIVSLDGQKIVQKSISTTLPKLLEAKKTKSKEIGRMLAYMVLEDGGKSILQEIKLQLNN